MSMRIRDLHDKLGHSGTINFILSQMKGIESRKHSLSHPAFIEALLKHSFLPKNFGESFDRIMSPEYALEDARANIQSDANGNYSASSLLSQRAEFQVHDILSLMKEARNWIEMKDKSYKHQKIMEVFRTNFQEYFEKGNTYEYDWDRLVTALKTHFKEELLPKSPKSEQLIQRCRTIISMIDAEKPPSGDQQKKLMKELDDLQWYFDNYIVGSTQIEDISNGADEPSEPVSMVTTSSPIQSLDGSAFAFDGKLMVLSDGAVYIGSSKTNDIEPCVGQTLFALLSKKAGYVSYLNIAHAIYGEHAKEPAKARKAAIRKYVSTLRTILQRYYPECEIENERGKGWIFAENAKSQVTLV